MAVHEVAIHVEARRPRLQLIDVLVVVLELLQQVLPLLSRLLRFNISGAEPRLDHWALEPLMLPVVQFVARAEVKEADHEHVLAVCIVVRVAALEIADEVKAEQVDEGHERLDFVREDRVRVERADTLRLDDEAQAHVRIDIVLQLIALHATRMLVHRLLGDDNTDEDG